MERVGKGNVKKVADLIGRELAVTGEEEKGRTVGVTEIVEINHRVEGDKRDEGVVGQVVEEEELELILEGKEVMLRSGEIDEKDEGKGMRRRRRTRLKRVLDGAVCREELSREIGIGDGTGKGVATRAEGAVPDA